MFKLLMYLITSFLFYLKCMFHLSDDSVLYKLYDHYVVCCSIALERLYFLAPGTRSSTHFDFRVVFKCKRRETYHDYCGNAPPPDLV